MIDERTTKRWGGEPYYGLDYEFDPLWFLTPEQLEATVTRTEPGWPQREDFPLIDCLWIVLNEEWEHRLYAERDLAVLEAS